MDEVKALLLPYDEISNCASITRIRSALKRTTDETYKIPLSQIAVRAGFNWRIKPSWMSDEEWEAELEIPELAASIFANGMRLALEGDLLDDLKTFVLTDGYRRYLANIWLFKNNNPEGLLIEDWMIKVKVNKPGTTELDRANAIFISQDNMKLPPMQMARGLLRLKEIFSYTNEKISTQWGKSRQWVDNMIKLNDLSEEIQEKLERKQISATEALIKHRQEKKEEKKKEDLPPLTLEILSGPPLNADNTEGIPPANTIEYLRKGVLSDSKSPADQEEENVKEGQAPMIGAATEPFKPIKYDGDSVHHQEEESKKATDPKFRDERPKNDRNDALPTIDFRKEKTEAEFDINESIKLLDKIEVQLDTLPNHQKKFADDIIRLKGIIVFNLNKVKETIHRAADRI